MLLLYSEIEKAVHESLLNAHLEIFPKEYQDKILRYHRWQDAQLSLVGRLLLKKAFSSFGVVIDFEKLCFTAYDKPFYADNKGMHFNISHSGKLVAAFFTDKCCEIGIDVEKISAMKIADFKNQMTRFEEQRIFNAEHPLTEFFKYWTEKEAVLKATGRGLSIPLKSFEIKKNHTQIDLKKFYVLEIDLHEKYACHISLNQKIESKEIRIKKIHLKEFLSQ